MSIEPPKTNSAPINRYPEEQGLKVYEFPDTSLRSDKNKLDLFLKSSEQEAKENDCKTVVRLKTSCWKDSRGNFHETKSLILLKRLCGGSNFLSEDASNIGVYDMMQNITNLNSVPDGIYKVDITNISTDWETGCVNDYDYELTSYEPDTKTVLPDNK